MIDIPVSAIVFADIERFVQDRHPEGKLFDDKRDTYGAKDDDKKELLKDVSSFANTIGGDILVRIDEDKGEPTSIDGIAVADIDKEKMRLEEIIRKGLEPRVDFGIHSLKKPEGRHVLVIPTQSLVSSPVCPWSLPSQYH